MNNPKSIESKVLQVLKSSVTARNDDMKLYAMVCDLCLKERGLEGIGDMPLYTVMNNYKNMNLPHFESVRRARQKIQEKYFELRCSENTANGRRKQKLRYLNYVRK